MFFSGFTARGWRDFYEEASYSSPTTITLKFTPFMAQLINLLWKRQTEFWAQYVETAPNLSGLSWHAENRKHEYIAKIRFLHRQKDQCMPAHQTQYFHENVEQFVSDATISQMRTYLQEYEKVILQSILAAKNRPKHTIFHFPGFHRFPSIRRPLLPPDSHFPPVETPHNNSSQQPGGPNLPHKHTRWKGIPKSRQTSPIRINTSNLHPRQHTRWRPAFPSTRSIRDFFRPSKPHSTSRHPPETPNPPLS